MPTSYNSSAGSAPALRASRYEIGSAVNSTKCMNSQGAAGTVTASRTCPCSSCAAKNFRRCHTRPTPTCSNCWCPCVHFEGPPNEPPGFLAFWRREADIADPLLVEPPKTDGIDLFECRLNAEYITEYPVSASFEAHFREDLGQWHEGGAAIYDDMLSAAPGVKLFGYPRWVGDAATPFCICGPMMKILVTIDMGEFGGRGDSVSRWRPVEEPEPDGSHGFSIGDPGALYLFHCPICPGPRLQATVQTA